MAFTRPGTHSTLDYENRKFLIDDNGEVYVAVVAASLDGLLAGVIYDAGTVTRPDNVTEVYAFRQGGVAGTIVTTVTLIYTNGGKDDLLSWERVDT